MLKYVKKASYGFIINCAPTWSLVGHFLHKAAETVLSPGKGRPACHSERFAALQSLPHAVVAPSVAYAGRISGTERRPVRNRRIHSGVPEKQRHIRLLAVSHLVLCDAFVLLQHLQQLLVLSVKLGDLLSVELQQLPGGTQVRQPLMDGGKRGIRFLTRGTNVGSVRKQKHI